MPNLMRRAFIQGASCALATPYIPQVNASTALERVNFQLINDISSSIKDGDLYLEKEGLKAALTDPFIMDAIIGKTDLLVSYNEFGTYAHNVIDWRRITSQSDLISFADAITSVGRSVDGDVSSSRSYTTAISRAYDNALARFASISDNFTDSARNVMDISGDGMENEDNELLILSRQRAISKGVQSNAIIFPDMEVSAITPEEYFENVHDFYQNNVITPEGFVMRVWSIYDYPPAIREKLEIELMLS